MILKPTMAEHLSGISAGLNSILPDLEGPCRRQVQVAVMFLKRLALRVDRFDGVLRTDTYDLYCTLQQILDILGASGDMHARKQVADFHESLENSALSLTFGDGSECPDSAYFIVRNLELQSLLVQVQDYSGTYSSSEAKEHVRLILRSFHERTLRRDVGLSQA